MSYGVVYYQATAIEQRRTEFEQAAKTRFLIPAFQETAHQRIVEGMRREIEKKMTKSNACAVVERVDESQVLSSLVVEFLWVKIGERSSSLAAAEKARECVTCSSVTSIDLKVYEMQSKSGMERTEPSFL